MPHPFDSDDEDISLRILRSLARYEDIDDLPEDTLSSILMNQALRTRMSAEKDANVQAELIRDEIVRAAAAAREDLKQERNRTRRLEEELEELRATVKEANAREAETREGARRSEDVIQGELAREREAKRSLEARLQHFETVLESERGFRIEAETRRIEKRYRFWLVVVALIVLLGLATGLVIPLNGMVRGSGQSLKLSVAIAVGVVAVWLFAIVSVGRRIAFVRSWSVFERFEKVAKWCARLAGIVSTSAAGSALWEWLRK